MTAATHTCVTHTGGHLGTLECLHQHVYNFSTHTCMHTVRVPAIYSSSHTQQQSTMKRNNIGAVTCMHIAHRAAGVLDTRTLGGQVGLVIDGERHCPSRDRPHGS